MVKTYRHDGEKAYSHKPLYRIEGGVFDTTAAALAFNAAFKNSDNQSRPIQRPAQVREKEDDGLDPIQVEKVCAHLTHHGEKLAEKADHLLVDPIHDLTEYGIYSKIEYEQSEHLP